MILLAPIPWVKRVWALPFLTVLAPSERYHQQQGRRHKKLTDIARQMITQVRRWLPHPALLAVAAHLDSPLLKHQRWAEVQALYLAPACRAVGWRSSSSLRRTSGLPRRALSACRCMSPPPTSTPATSTGGVGSSRCKQYCVCMCQLCEVATL